MYPIMRVVKHDKRKYGIGDDNRLEGVRLKVKNKENSTIKFVIHQQLRWSLNT